jgi:AP-3 complex subunit delta
MWERTLQDLIRGLRSTKTDEAKFIAQAVDEIREEVKSKDMELKAAAVLKLTYVRPYAKVPLFSSVMDELHIA